jgi:hypothetical protein
MAKKILIGVGVVFLLLIILIVIGGSGEEQNTQNNQQNQPSNQQPQEVLSVQTESFIAEFDNNQLAAEEKYADKWVEFTARIKNISEDILGTPFLSLEPVNAGEYYFGTSIQCMFKENSELTSLSNGQTVTLQGKVASQLSSILIKNCKVI